MFAGALILVAGVTLAPWSARAADGLWQRVTAAIGLAPTTVATDTGLAAAIAALPKAAAEQPATAPVRTGQPVTPRPVVAVHATPVGHVTFARAANDTYTAGTPTELARASASVLPGLSGGFRDADLVLSFDTLFAGGDTIRQLPEAASVRVVLPASMSQASSAQPAVELLAVERRARGALAVRVSRHLVVPVDDRPQLIETLAQLRRPVEASAIRVLSVADRGPTALPSAPRLDAASGMPAVDVADVDRLAEVIASVPRQTVVLTAKLAGADAKVELPSGAVRTLALADLLAAARAADVDLLVLDTDPPRQTGGRTWAYRSVKIAGADRALKARRLQDSLEVLAEARGGFEIRTIADGAGRVRLIAEPARATGAGTLGIDVSGWLGAAEQAAEALTGEVMGTVKPRAVLASLVDTARREELAARLIPGLPLPGLSLALGSPVGWLVGASLLVVLLGWRTARVWWRRLWPLEQRSDYSGAVGYTMARLVRGVAFLAVFLPIASLPAAVSGLIRLMVLRRPARPPAAS
jgi:hypothetical protein